MLRRTHHRLPRLWQRTSTGLALLAALALLCLACGHARAAVFTVTSNADTDGTTCGATCTLRQALNAVNAAASGAHTIAFAIPGTGVHVIAPATPLPTLTHANVTIDGYTQPGAAPNTLAEGDDAVILIQLDGTLIPPNQLVDGLSIAATDVTVRGLAITDFANAGSNGIVLGLPGNRPADRAVIEGCFIGLAPDGVTAGGNGSAGILLNGSAAVRIGGTDPASRNVISANGAGNEFGGGIAVINIGVDGSTILGNYLGTTAQGDASRGNHGAGVSVYQFAKSVTIGGVAAGAANRIAFNFWGVVVLNGSTGIDAAANEFHTNSRLGIELSASAATDGVTSNDVNDTDDGGNHLQNFPVLTSATLDYGRLLLQGSLDIPHVGSVTPRPYSIVAYASSACDGTAHGPGERLLGSAQAVLFDDLVLRETFALDYAPAPLGSQITATATDGNGNTSEFSACITVTLGDGIFKDGFGNPD